MAKKMFLQILSVLALLSLQASGQEKIMVCKDIQNVFTNGEDLPGGSQVTRLQGPPGKKGVQGVQGPPGLRGVQGIPGIPGVVNYTKISEMIEEKIRQLPQQYCSVGAGYGGKIPDSSFTASSEYNAGHAAHRGRLNAPTHGWTPLGNSRPGSWIQVDLGQKTSIRGVMIQGRALSDNKQWVTSFHVGCGLTSHSMRKITDYTGSIKVFSGNIDKITVVDHIFHREVQCRYLRIYPLTWNLSPTLRMDFLKSC